MAYGGSSASGSAVSFRDIQQEQLEEESMNELAQSRPSAKKKPKKSRAKKSASDEYFSVRPRPFEATRSDECLLPLPGTFEESFNASYNVHHAVVTRKAKLSPSEVNNLARKIISDTADDELYVSLELVKEKLCEIIGVRNLKDVGYRNPDIEIPELKELQRLHSKLDLYARAYVMVHSIATLKELGHGMARLQEKSDFLELKVGPLVKLPVVYDLFKAPSDGSANQQITTLHILKNLNKYLTEKEKWTSKVKLEDFMQYLCEEYDCESPYEIGVRVQSVGLGISVLKRAQKAQSERSKVVEQELAADLEKEFERRCKKIKDELLGSSHGDERSILGKLLGSGNVHVTDVLTKVFDHSCVILQHPSVRKGDPIKVSRCLEAFVASQPLRTFFNLALHMGCKEIVKDLLDECKEDMKIEIQEKEYQEKEKAIKPPNKSSLIQEVKQWLNSAEDLSLPTLAHIEGRVIDRFSDFLNFVSLGYGAFLEFLTNEPELNKILEERGALLSGGAVNQRQASDVGVLEFVHQCGPHASKDAIQRTVCAYYNVNKITELGFGSYDNLVSKINRRKRQHEPGVYYESALLCKDDISVFGSFPNPCNPAEPAMKAGLLGWKSQDEGLKALRSTPLLGDMKEWTQWTTVFEPCLGDLKRFIEGHDRSGPGCQIQALETSSKVLLRIDTKTTPEEFYKFVDEDDVIGASGTLVSLVINYGGIKATPFALITNHMRPNLSKLASADQVDGGFRCPQFVLDCLCRIPQNICMALADKVFLEPLGFAVGTTNSSQLLLSCCTNDEQRSRLHQLGLGLGKSEWRKDLESTIAGERMPYENEKRFTDLKVVKPVALVEPVRQVQQISRDSEGSQEESFDSADLLKDDEEEKVENEESTSANEEEETVIPPNPCKAIIDSIRKEEFGIGVVLGKEEEKLIQKQREREGRSLHRLSAELYNRDTHFVLELVQNADDNRYTDEIPALMFVVDPKRIVVLNNEVGFSEKNIRALCDVGKSTKGPHQYGYIGQKGIGFKSVFRISDTPEVHSHGYHIRFDAKSGPSGYILPHWIDEEDETHIQVDSSSVAGPGNSGHGCKEIVNTIDTEYDGWMTKIVLPLKDEFHSDKKTSLSARFHDVHPSLLLFLHRLRSIAIVKDNKAQQMTREDLDGGIIQINHSNGTDRWLVVKKQLNALDVRKDVEMTELALAFPMFGGKESTNVTSYKALPAQNVFAYLPLRSYGFKFIIQGDFEVPSSREDVDGDKAWNQWLREEIPKLFIDALDVFKQHPLFSGLSSVAKFFQFVPLEEEIMDFFTPVASAILKYLQGIPCLPVEKPQDTGTKKTAGNIGGDSKDYDWMQPCTVVVCDDPKVHAFVTPYLLRKHLNLNYLSQEVSHAINPALRAKLGLQTLSVKHLIDIGRSVLKDSGSGPLDVPWIAGWLHCISRCLESEHNSSTETLNEIAVMDIIPLSNGTFVNLKDHAVFFPLSVDQQTTNAKKRKSKPTYLLELERDLSVLHPELLTRLGNVGQSQVEQLLRHLGVKNWAPRDVIHNHILPTLKSDKWKSKSDAVLQSYLVYVFDQYLTDKTVCSIDELKGCCQVLTNHGPMNPSTKPVHFTPRYGNTLDLRADLPSISWTLLDDSYLDMSTHHNAQQDWEKFFSTLGVGHFLAMERKTTRLTKMNLDDSPWASYHGAWRETSDGAYTVDDYCCSELEEFMQKPKDPKQAKILAENLDKLWTTQYSMYSDYVPVKDTEGCKLQETVSSFMHSLRTSEWLPVLAASPSTFEVPRKLFANIPQLRGLLDEHVSYAGVSLEDQAFVNSIGLVCSISVEGLLEHLISWSREARYSATAVGQENEFVTPLAHMKEVYAFLKDNCQIPATKAKITDAFQSNPLIFVPEKSEIRMPERRVRGRFYSMKEVCWNDPSEVTQKLFASKRYTPKRHILSPHYKELHDFLRIDLHIDPTPHTDEYIEMAGVLVEEKPLPTPAVLEPILKIFAVLGEKCLKEKPKPTFDYMGDATYPNPVDGEVKADVAKYLQTRLLQEAIFPCTERWVTLGDKPIVPDNKQLRKIFEQEKDVHFITLECSTVKATSRAARNLPGDQKKTDSVKVFFRACGIPKLSEIVEEELTPRNVEYQCHEVQLYFHQIIPCVQRYLYTNLEKKYKALKDQCFAKKLSEMTFATVEKLEVVYRLKGHPEVTVGQDIKYGFQNVGQALHFYAVRQQSKSTESLNKVITDLFTDATDVNSIHFGNFLSRLSTKLEEGLANFLEEQDIDPLPNHEEAWFVPEPEIPTTPEIETVEEYFDPPAVRRVVHSDNDGALHCWPPRSSVTGIKPTLRDNEPNQQKATEMWPEPEAPESMRNQPHSLDGSRLQSYIPSVGDQHKKERNVEDSGTQMQTVLKHDDAANSKQAVPHQNAFVTEKQIQNPVIPEENSTAPAVAEAAVNELHLSPQVISPNPSPTDGNALPEYLPVGQQSSTPKAAGTMLAVYSPSIQVTLEDLEVEELPTENEVSLPLNVSIDENSDKSEIGRWGEMFVYEYLRRQTPPENRIVEVRWVNQVENSTAPYDIQIISRDVTGRDPGVITYIEVKSTSAEVKEHFEISVPELRFALEKREGLHLYRVFNAGNSQAIRILRVQNLAGHLERKSVKVFMVI